MISSPSSPTTSVISRTTRRRVDSRPRWTMRSMLEAMFRRTAGSGRPELPVMTMVSSLRSMSSQELA